MSKLVPASSRSSNGTQLKACRYDVFLSFRGTNTRKNFTGHLLKVLTQNGYHTFHDSMLPRGESIDSELLKAIEVSRMSIIVFSRNYADSKWCLDELVKIMYCRSCFQQIVLPVFLDVEPSEVRKQEGCFAKAFANHQKKMDRETVENWRQALKGAGKLSGLHLQNDTNGHEAELVEKIINEVGKHLKQPYLNVAYYPVGIESRMVELMQLLDLETDDVRIVAIWGVGGLGKTTIAKATYNCIFPEFESSCFLEDIKDSEKTTLQNKLMVDLMTDKTPRINNVHRGTEEIRRILQFQRVLLFLDDVNHFDQLEMLAIDRRVFCPGSRIIITTRNKDSVSPLQMDGVYELKALNEFESLKLFSLYAFGEDHPQKGYEVLTKEVVRYAEGIPLVLKTLGSSSSTLSKSEWRDNLKKLNKVPSDDVQGKLMVSYYSLDDVDKQLFLNISCFFMGMDKDLMIKVLEDSNCFPKISIKRLVNRALVNIDGGVLSLHNLIRDMGREIVRQESLKEPGERSRLWDHDDIAAVFRQCSGTAAVESIIHGNYNNFKPLGCVNVEAFEKMPNLKLLLLHHVSLNGTYNQVHSFEKLKYLQWHGFPMENMPSKLNMENLVVMDMQFSRLKLLWEGTMSLGKLQFLNLSDSCYLIRTPDFSGMKNLEKLLLGRCSKLIELHSSVTSLDKLLILDLSYCVRLKRAPSVKCILKMKSLKELYVYHCPKLSNKDDTSTSQSTGRRCLTKLSLVQCNLLLVPSEIGRLVSLVTLELQENKFSSLPALKNLHQLKQLTLSYCVKLKSIPDLPRNVVMIIAVNCVSLRGLPSNMSDLHLLDELRLSGCQKLGSEDLMNLTKLCSLSFLEMDSCNVANVPSEIGNLVSLDFLNLGQNKFSSLPASLSNLQHLLDLNLSDCMELQTIPDLPRNLTSFKASNCISLINIPSNMSELTSLRELHLDGCSELGYEDPFCFEKLKGLSSLVYLNMKSCNLSCIPYEIKGLVSLSRLDLSENIFCSLPVSLCNLKNLKELELNYCAELRSFPVLPPDFTVLKADNCPSLEMIPFKQFFLHGSGQELRFSHSPEWVGNNYACKFWSYILRFHQELFQFHQVWPIIPEIKISLSGTKIPDWCTYRGSGQFLSLVVPADVDKKLSGWIYCAIAPECKDDECRLKCKVVNKTKGRADYIGTTLCGHGPMFLAFVPYLIDLIPRLTFTVEGGDELVLGFELECENNWTVQECGLCLIYEGDNSASELNTQKVIEYTPSDLCQHLHEMLYEQKWEEYKETYLMHINSRDDDGDSDDYYYDTVGDDDIGEDDGGGYDEWPPNIPTEGGPWFLLRPEELGDWIHHHLAAPTKFL